MRYLVILFLVHYSRIIERIIMSKQIKFNDSLTLTFLMFLAEIIGGFSVFIYQNMFLSKSNKKNVVLEKMIISKRTNQELTQKHKASSFKIILLIFFAAFFDFTEFIIGILIPKIAVLSPTCDTRICIFITICSSLLCIFALRIKTGKHHTISLIGMAICCTIVFIIELIYKSKGVNFWDFIQVYLLVSCRLIFVSLIDVTEKYLVEFCSVNMFKVLGSEGSFGFLLTLIYSFIKDEKPFSALYETYIELEQKNKTIFIILLILHFLLCAGVNIYKIMCNVIYNPMVKSLSGYLLNPIYITYYFIYGNDFLSDGEKNYGFFFINLVLSIIVDFFSFMYNEFFILNCCGMNKDTHHEITKRAISKELEEFNNLDDSFENRSSNKSDKEDKEENQEYYYYA